MIKKLQIINQTSAWAPKQGSVSHYSMDPEGHQMETQWNSTHLEMRA